jgi:hypothetical protein
VEFGFEFDVDEQNENLDLLLKDDQNTKFGQENYYHYCRFLESQTMLTSVNIQVTSGGIKHTNNFLFLFLFFYYGFRIFVVFLKQFNF